MTRSLPRFGIPWSFVIRHSSFACHISRPDDDPNQSLPGAFCVRGAAHGAADPNAAAKERRFGCGVWRRRHGKYFWGANHQCAYENDGVACGYFFPSNIRPVSPLCTQKHGRQRAPARAAQSAGRSARFAFSSCSPSFSSACFGRSTVGSWFRHQRFALGDSSSGCSGFFCAASRIAEVETSSKKSELSGLIAAMFATS